MTGISVSGASVGWLKGPPVSLGTAGAILANGLVGGLIADAAGGKFGAGFLAAGFSAAASPYISLGGRGFNTIAHAIVGGIASVLGGGKFANGAITGAFQYLYNEAAAEDTPFDLGRLKNLKRDGNRLTGTVSVGCGDGIDCAKVIADLNRINHRYENGYEVDIDFVPAEEGDPTPDVSVMYGYCSNPSALACAGSSANLIFLTPKYDYQPNVLPHEYGHILGFGHNPHDRSNLMYKYTNQSQPGYLSERDAKRLIDAYPE